MTNRRKNALMQPVTAKMQAVGERIISEYRFGWSDGRDFVKRIYRSMAAAAQDVKSTSERAR